MTSPHTATRSGVRSDTGLRGVLIVLCVTEITSWGVLYYAFPVLASSITRDTGWSTPMTAAAFSAALIVSGLVGIPVGRYLDRYGPRAVMTTGSVLAGLAVLVVANAPTLPWFFAGWLIVGVAMAGTLYVPAFAALTRFYGDNRVPALTTLTLVAGLASTVFAPLTAALNAHLDWRHTYLVLAVVLAVVTIPAHAVGLRRPWPAIRTTPAPSDSTDAFTQAGDPKQIARSGAFIALALAMSLAGFTFYAVVINLVPLLQDRGMSTSSAATALALGGVGQVAGRLGYARLAARTTVRARTIAIFLIGAATTVLLGLVPGPVPVLIGLSILAGTARGIFTLLQATAISDRWGIRHYGRLNGIISAPVLFAEAVAPAAGAALAATLGYPTGFVILAAILAAAVVLIGGNAGPIRSADA